MNAEELKEYGEKLQVRTGRTGEKYLAAGREEFNINSPKAAWSDFFEKLQMPGEEDEKPDIPRRQMYWKSWLQIMPLYRIFWNTASLPN